MSPDLFLRLYDDCDESGMENTVPADSNEYRRSAGPEVIEGGHIPRRTTLEERWNTWIDEINR